MLMISFAVVGTPSDVALVRMQADATLPVEQRRNYRNVFQAIGFVCPNRCDCV